jgi:hypothetical protein
VEERSAETADATTAADSQAADTHSTALRAGSAATEELPKNLPASLNVNELQALQPEEVEKLCSDFELRVYPGRSRHQLILDLVRAALARNIPVTTTGFFDPVADNFGVLRWPRLISFGTGRRRRAARFHPAV